LDENRGYIRVGKSNILSTSDNEYYLLSSGEGLSMDLTENTEPVYYVIDPGAPAGTYRLTVLATN